MNIPGHPTAQHTLRLLLLCLGMLLSVASGGALAAPKPPNALDDPVSRFRDSLDRDEIAWLAAHPEIRVGNGPDFQPFYAWKGTQYTGPSADYLDLISRRTGLHFRLQRFADFPAVLDALHRGEIDLIPTLTPTEARRKKFLFTGGYLHSPAVVVTRSDASGLALPASFEGVRVAIEKGHASRDVLQRSKPTAIFVEFADTAAALRAVSTGETDAYVGMLAVAHYYIEQLALANLQVRRRFHADLSAMALAVSQTQPQLHSILRKAMQFVSDDEGNALMRRYRPTTTGIPGEAFSLTRAEQAWLRSHGPVRMGYDQAFYPLSYTNPKHQAEGYSIELFRLLRDKAGLTVDETAGPWSTVLTKAISNDLDVLVATASTAQRREQLLFVGPYLSTPTVIVTRSNFQQVWDLSGFAERKLALLKGHFLINRIRSTYPNIQLIEVPAQEDALSLVAAGSADVAIGNLHAVNRLIQSRFLGALYIAGHVPDGDSELYLGVSNKAPELAAILHRALDSLTPEEINAAKNRWLDTVYTPAQPRSSLLTQAGPPLASALLVMLAGGAYGFIRLRRERRARQTAETRLAAWRQALLDSAHQLKPVLQRLDENASRLQHSLAADDASTATETLEHIRQDRRDIETLVDALLAPEHTTG